MILQNMPTQALHPFGRALLRTPQIHAVSHISHAPSSEWKGILLSALGGDFRILPTEASLLPPQTAAAYRSCGWVGILLWGCDSTLLVLVVSSSPSPVTDTWILSVLASDGCLGNAVLILRVPSPRSVPPAPVQGLEVVRIL